MSWLCASRCLATRCGQTLFGRRPEHLAAPIYALIRMVQCELTTDHRPKSDRYHVVRPPSHHVHGARTSVAATSHQAPRVRALARSARGARVVAGGSGLHGSLAGARLRCSRAECPATFTQHGLVTLGSRARAPSIRRSDGDHAVDVGRAAVPDRPGRAAAGLALALGHGATAHRRPGGLTRPWNTRSTSGALGC
jgi:hypothetical protein